MGSTMARRESPQDDFLPFLTAWDPSDLPGGSVDPLGFDRGYTFLADKILPGLTNVARHPRYLGVLHRIAADAQRLRHASGASAKP